jgi:hypothetical protein
LRSYRISHRIACERRSSEAWVVRG